MVRFEDTKTAYILKSDQELRKAYLLFRLFSKQDYQKRSMQSRPAEQWLGMHTQEKRELFRVLIQIIKR